MTESDRKWCADTMPITYVPKTALSLYGSTTQDVTVWSLKPRMSLYVTV